MHALLISIFASVIPARYRGRFLADHDVNVQRGAVVSGIVQVVFFLSFIVFRYMTFIHIRMTAAEEVARQRGLTTGEQLGPVAFGSGILGFIEYIFSPLTIFFFYLAFEGVIRITAAVATNEVLPSLPFQTMSWMHSLLNRQSHSAWLGPRIADIVTEVDATNHVLRIESCRTKPWDIMMTVDYNDVHYELAKYSEQGPPRRFVYLLRRIPPNKLIRGLHHYDPNEELNLED